MLRPLALALTALTGFSGLVYEVTWEKYLATLLGSHSEAAASVLGLFLGGLALGYAGFGRVTRRRVEAARAAGTPARLLGVYGGVEIAIGVFAICFPALFGGVRALSLLLPGGTGPLGFAFDVLLSALLVLPPAVLMGGTIPLLTQALARSLDDATRFHALVYASNTAGAFAGALAAGFWLIPSLGLDGSLLAVAGINVGAGLLFLLLEVRTASAAQPSAPQRAAGERSPAASGFGWFAAAAALGGFAMMSLQTVLIRLGALAFGASQFTFSMVVAVFVLCIALGSLAVSALSRVPRGLLVADAWAVPIAFALLYRPLQDAPYWAHALRALFANLPEGFYPYYAAAFLCLLAAIGLPVALAGATLPLLFDHLRRAFGELGGTAGRLYSWNTLGSLLGALLGGYALLFWVDLHAVYRLALVSLAAAAALLTWRVLPRGRAPALAALLVFVAVAAALPRWQPGRLSAGLFRQREKRDLSFAGPDAYFAKYALETAFYTDDPTASVAVRRFGSDSGSLAILVNGKSDGAVPPDMVTMSLAALVPALLAEKAERAFVIGYGTGVSAGTFAALSSSREVVVAEISPGVIEAAPFFDDSNHAASRNPKLKIVRSDAYRALLRSRGGFDVIVSEPSNPWVTGVEMLYSREFLAAARERLAPGGVYAQWFHTYEVDPPTVALVLRTYAAVFEHVSVWYAMGGDLLLLGITDPGNALDVDRLRDRARRPDFAAALASLEIDHVARLLAHELLPLGVLHAIDQTGPIHTLAHPHLSYQAARAFFAGGEGLLPVSAGLAAARVGWSNSLLRRAFARPDGGYGEGVWALVAAETCQHRPRECVTLLAAWERQIPDSPARERLEDEIRRRPLLRQMVDLELMKQVAVLFGTSAEGDAAPLRRARQASASFEIFYHHAAPFPRAELARLWRRCEQDSPGDPQRCRAGRLAAERKLGSLNAPLALGARRG